MVLKRPLGEGRDEASENKRRHSTKFKGVSSARNLQDSLPIFEPMIQKVVREAVKSAFEFYLRPSDGPVEASGSKTLKFLSKVAHTVFTGNSIVSVHKTPIKLALYDSALDEIVTSGPYSSMKVEIVVLEGDFAHDDWSKKDFNGNVVLNREGKRPLATGELTVTLQNGEGYIGNFSFTDNSSWTRSKRFRLGVKVHSDCDDTSVGEGISNAFRVKDHRGEVYKKHYPPSWNDEVWRLEKIAKDGPSHISLTQSGVSCVGDFLRFYETNHLYLRNVLVNVSNKKWEAILAHARTCILDGQSCPSLHSLNSSQMKMVDCDAKFHAGLGQGNELLETPTNSYHPAISSQENSSFEIGEGSQMQGLNMAFSNSFGMSDSSGRFLYFGDETWPAGMDSEQSPPNCRMDDNF